MDAEKRKKKSSRGRKAETQELCNGESVARAAPAVKQKTGIHMAVMIFGMILALVVGIFLGTFITQWRESISRNPMPTGEALTQPSAPTAPAPVSSPAVKVAESETATRGEAQVVSSGLSASAHAGQDPRIVELEEAVLKNPDNPRVWADLGNLYFDTGQTRKAVSAYERSLTLAPDNADVLTDLGTMYRELGDYERAITSFRRASTVNPSHENALFNEGVVLYFDLHRKDEAQKAWQRLLRLNPDARAPDGRSVADILGTLR